MLIELETPYNPGDNDPGQTYPHCKMVLLTHNPVMACTVAVYEFGHEDPAGAWQRGPGAPAARTVIITDEELATAAPVVLCHAFQGLELLCYQCLVLKGLVAGAIRGDSVPGSTPAQEEADKP